MIYPSINHTQENREKAYVNIVSEPFLRISVLKQEIHQRAINATQRYLQSEIELIEVLQLADQHRVYLDYGHSSLFQYAVQSLGISESIAYNLIAVCRKSKEIPELKLAIQNGEITLSNARKLSPILTSGNQSEWITKASSLSSRQLEKEIARVNPKLATPEKITYATAERVQLTLGLSEQDMLKLRRAQDLVCQSKKSHATLEDTLVTMLEEFLIRKDPTRKARRIIAKKGIHAIQDSENEPKVTHSQIAAQSATQSPIPTISTSESTTQNATQNAAPIIDNNLSEPVKTPVALQAQKRKPLPAAIAHQVWLRDEGRCTFTNSNGIRCRNTRFIEIHHIHSVALGGDNQLKNLATLCSTHHRHLHASS